MAKEDSASTAAPNLPVVVDMGTYCPVPRNTFRFIGRDGVARDFPAFDLLQLRRADRNRFAQLDELIQACKTIEDQEKILLDLYAVFVPGIPVDELRDESFDSLIVHLIKLGNPNSTPEGKERPT